MLSAMNGGSQPLWQGTPDDIIRKLTMATSLHHHTIVAHWHMIDNHNTNIMSCPQKSTKNIIVVASMLSVRKIIFTNPFMH